ncbi:MAG: PhoH family protein [bacterium]
MTRKIFVLDTNVILSDPKAIFNFAEHDIVVPMVVIEELDKFKKDMNQIGLAARAFARHVESLRKQGQLVEGVKLESGGTIRIDTTADVELPGPKFNSSYADNIILAAAYKITKENPGREVTLVSKDVNLRIKADVLGIKADTYRNETVNFNQLPRGYESLTVEGELIDRVFGPEKKIPLSELAGTPFEHEKSNKFFMLTDEANEQHQGVVRIDPFENALVPLKQFKGVWGLRARNFAQKLALDILMDDRIKLVSLMGTAGTGKTLLAIACGLQKCLDEGKYTKMLVARPIYPMGRDIGFLPGTIEEKLKPWMQPVFDNLEYLLAGYDSSSFGKMNDLLNSGVIEIEALTYIRGRSIPEQFIIVDEAQNLTPHEVKTIVSRVGENTKIVLTGDPFQIDNPYMNESSNGLSYIVDRFQNLPLAAHIILEKGERSALANAAAELL